MTKSVFGLVLCFCGIGCMTLSAQEKSSQPYKGSPEALHVYLLMGQSNMAGRAPFAQEDAGVIDRCYLLNADEEWEPAQNPLNRYSTIRKGIEMQKMGPGYSFAKAMLAKDKSISIGLVVNAKGGTNIDQWRKGTLFYKESLRRAKDAQKTGTLKGILWHQGESDNKMPDGYLQKLQSLIQDIRGDLGLPNLAFIAGQVNDVKLINDQIARLPETVPATGFVSSDGLQVMDRWHFDTKSIKILGERYAKEMLRVQAESSQISVSLPATGAELSPFDLTCECLVNPMCVETVPPRLAWKLSDARRGGRL